MTVPRIEVAAAKYQFGMCNCTIESDDGIRDFLLILWILHVLRHTHAIAHISGHGLL